MNRIIKAIIFALFPFILAGQVTPNYTFDDSDGINHDLYADYLDQGKVVFIEFMFISCPPCKAYLPFMKDLYAEFGSGNGDVEFFHFTTVFADNNANMAAYKIEENIPFPMVGSDGSSFPTFQEYSNGSYGSFLGTPTFAIINPDGEVTLVRPPGNQSTWNPVLSDLINEAIGTPPPPPPPATYDISGTILGNDGNIFQSTTLGTTGVIVSLSGDVNMTTTENPFTFEGITEGMNVEISVETTNDLVLAGISTFDIVLITQQILGSVDLSLVQQVASDVNCSGSISTFDIINLRQLILFATQEIPCGSYRSVPESEINDPNATLGNLSDKISISNISEDLSDQNLYLIKLGNVN